MWVIRSSWAPPSQIWSGHSCWGVRWGPDDRHRSWVDCVPPGWLQDQQTCECECPYKTIQHNMRKRTCRVILNSASAPTTLDDDLPNRRGANKVKTSKKQTLSTSNKKTRSMRQSTSNIQTNKLCPATFLLMVLPKSFCAIELLRLYLTVFNRVVLTSTSLEERAAVFVFFHFLLNKLAAGQRLVIKCDHGRLMMDTALKVLDEIPTSRGGFLCSLCSAMALLGRQLVGQVYNNFLDKVLCASSWI